MESPVASGKKPWVWKTFFLIWLTFIISRLEMYFWKNGFTNLIWEHEVEPLCTS
jgi:hypothetical protein